MAQGLVDARWVAPYGAQLDSGLELVPHETVVKVPKDEAEASENWEPVSKRKAKDTDE